MFGGGTWRKSLSVNSLDAEAFVDVIRNRNSRDTFEGNVNKRFGVFARGTAVLVLLALPLIAQEARQESKQMLAFVWSTPKLAATGSRLAAIVSRAQ